MEAVTRTTGSPGRYLVSSRANHFVVDGGKNRGGTGEAPTPGEYLLAGIGSCACVVIAGEAARDGVAFTGITSSASDRRDPGNEHRIIGIDLEIRISGMARPEAERLLKVYVDECPVYGLVARGTDLTVTLTLSE